MKTTIEKVSSLARKINVEVPAEEVRAAFERAYKGIQRQVTIKGFRKGKAPLATVRTLFKDRVQQDVVQDLVQKYYSEALGTHSVQPVNFPNIEFDAVEEDKDFSFSAHFEIRPDVKLTKVEGLQVKKERFVMDDKIVDTTLDNMRQARAEVGPLFEERPAQNGDIAVIDFEGSVEGAPLENGSAQDHELELGSNSFIPGFEEQIVGMRVGVTANINLKFPDDYHAKDIAGKPVTFKVTLKALKKKSLPTLNDEFAKSLGGKFETLENLRNEIRGDFEKREMKRINEDLKQRLVKVLVEANPVEVPQTLMEEQKKLLVDDMRKRMGQERVPMDQIEEYVKKWDADFNQTAAFMVRSSFLIDQYSEQFNLRATPEDIDQKINQYAAETGIEGSKVKEFYNNGDRKSRLLYQITEDKVVAHLLERAKVTEVDRSELKEEA